MAREDGGVPYLDETVDASSVRTTLPKILALIRPDWNSESVQIEDKSDGYCNKNVVCRKAEHPDDDFLIRVVNEHIPGLLAKNINTMKFMQRFSLCPPLLCTFKNGLCMGFVKGTPVTWASHSIIREEPHWRIFVTAFLENAKPTKKDFKRWIQENVSVEDIPRFSKPNVRRINIGREMARYHTLAPAAEALAAGISESSSGVNDQLLERVGAVLGGGSIPKEALDRLPTQEDLKSGRNRLSTRLKSLGADSAFIHLDVNPSNVILTDDPDEGKRAFFVDYDCCCIGPAILDIGWTFSSSLDIMNPDLSIYPDDAAQKTFFRAYLERRSVLRGGEASVSERDVRYLQFLLRTARLCAYLRMMGAALIMQTFSSRIQKMNQETGLRAWDNEDWVAFKMWKFYKENIEAIMIEKFTE